MELVNWSDKSLRAVQQSLLFGKYFDAISMEYGMENHYFVNPDLGIDVIVTMDKTIQSIHLYGDGHQQVNRFSGCLPYDIKFSFTRDQVHKIFGLPTLYGGGGASLLYEVVPQWDKYVLSNHYIHFQYGLGCQSISLLTLGGNYYGLGSKLDNKDL